MTQEDKELLLRDLCARLPYHTIVNYRGAKVDLSLYVRSVRLENCKPYLRPMSSMTEEEKKELQNVVKSNPIRPFGKLTNKCDNLTLCCAYGSYLLLNYLYSKHFDVIGLIEKGLALEVPEGMYNIKNK